MSPKHRTPKDDPEYPLTLTNLRLALAGRLGRPMRQQDAAKKAKISQSHLSNVERAHEGASQFLLFRLSEVYEVDLEVVRRALRGTAARLDKPARASKSKPIFTKVVKRTTKRKS